ncbi:MAG: DNA-binding response regulator [Chitinophagaceae bacterium]|nr:DNA-binding response regulator [Chitinophagaceae bacterium]
MSRKENTNILVVEDEMITAESIVELLEEEDFHVIGVARDAATALLLCSQADALPQVVICDIHIKGETSGIELARQLKKMHGCEIVFLTAYADSKTLESAFSIDPVMYVVKPYSDAQLLVAVQMAFHKLFRQESETLPRLELTEREREVATLVAKGLSSKQIANKLGISLETVKTHRRRMLQKNNISSFPHLIYLLNNGSGPL